MKAIVTDGSGNMVILELPICVQVARDPKRNRSLISSTVTTVAEVQYSGAPAGKEFADVAVIAEIK